MNYQKLNAFRFGIAGGTVTALFILTLIILGWIFLVPFYNSMMSALYGTTYGGGKIMFFSVLTEIISFIIGFLSCFIFAWTYNKLLLIRVK